MTEIEKFLALPPEEQEKKIKRLLHQTIHDGPPEVKETAYEMGLSPYTLYKWGSTESEKVPRSPPTDPSLAPQKQSKVFGFFRRTLWTHPPLLFPKS